MKLILVGKKNRLLGDIVIAGFGSREDARIWIENANEWYGSNHPLTPLQILSDDATFNPAPFPVESLRAAATEREQRSIDSIASETADAYSYDRYGEQAWKQSIRFLREQGLSDRAIIAMLRSKVMRWAADNAGDLHLGRALEKYQNQWSVDFAGHVKDCESGKWD